MTRTNKSLVATLVWILFLAQIAILALMIKQEVRFQSVPVEKQNTSYKLSEQDFQTSPDTLSKIVKIKKGQNIA